MQNFEFATEFFQIDMHLTVLGINHRTAPVEVRSKVAFPPESVGQALAELRGLDGICEAAILSTCNRTELYCARDELAADSLASWLGNFHQLPPEALKPHLYSYQDEIAVRHAVTGIPGPAFLELPMDILMTDVKPERVHFPPIRTAPPLISPQRGPTIWRPIGSPLDDWVSGTITTGCPVRLKGLV